MKEININDMEQIRGGGLLRTCMLLGGLAMAGITLSVFTLNPGGFLATSGAIISADYIGCFD